MAGELVKKENAIDTYGAESLMAQAIQQGANIDVMERLMVMREKIKAERAREDFFLALAGFQSECPVIEKTKKVLNASDKTVRYSYAPLDSIVEQVKSFLKKYELSYTLATEQSADNITVTCTAHHASGHAEPTKITVQIDPKSYMSGPQKVGAAVTYAKRYAFCNAFGIMTGDEDTDAVDDTPAPEPTKAAAPAPAKKAEAPKESAELSALKSALNEHYKITKQEIDRTAYLRLMTKKAIKIETAEISKLTASQQRDITIFLKAETESVKADDKSKEVK